MDAKQATGMLKKQELNYMETTTIEYTNNFQQLVESNAQLEEQTTKVDTEGKHIPSRGND